MAFTFFFRDQHTLELIAQYVIPDLKRHMYINIWDAGCAMGPEPYSLAITLRENMGPFLFRNVRIYATDIDERGDFGTTIQQGIYPESRIKRIPAELLQRYFTLLDDVSPLQGGTDGWDMRRRRRSAKVVHAKGQPGQAEREDISIPPPLADEQGMQEGNGRRTATVRYYQISEEMRKAVIFQQHDLLSLEPIRGGFGLILCKNVLLHFTPQERVAVIKMFHEALAPDGYLVTEQTQKLPQELSSLFYRVTSAGQVFQKQPVVSLSNHLSRAKSGVEHAKTKSGWGTLEADGIEIKTDWAFTGASKYTWLNIELKGQRIGKVRVDISGDVLKIYSLTIFPEFQGHGYARKVITLFQTDWRLERPNSPQSYKAIVADRVRYTAKGFWEKLGFVDDNHGNYVWPNIMAGH